MSTDRADYCTECGEDNVYNIHHENEDNLIMKIELAGEEDYFLDFVLTDGNYKQMTFSVSEHEIDDFAHRLTCAIHKAKNVISDTKYKLSLKNKQTEKKI